MVMVFGAQAARVHSGQAKGEVTRCQTPKSSNANGVNRNKIEAANRKKALTVRRRLPHCFDLPLCAAQ